MPSPPSTRPSDARERRSSAFVREGSGTASGSTLLVDHRRLRGQDGPWSFAVEFIAGLQKSSEDEDTQQNPTTMTRVTRNGCLALLLAATALRVAPGLAQSPEEVK